MDYIGDIVVPFLIALLIFMLLGMQSCSSNSDIKNSLIDASSHIADSENLLMFMRSPVTGADKTIVYQSSSQLEFDNGKDIATIDFGSDKEKRLGIVIPDKDSLKDISSASFKAVPGYGKNIAVIKGSADDIVPKLNSMGIYPDEITWDEFNYGYDTLFIGCSSPEPKNPEYVKAWIDNGGTLITTDYAIDTLGKIIPDAPIYSGKDSFRSTVATIASTTYGDAFSLPSQTDIEGIYWYDNIKDGREMDVQTLAVYSNKLALTVEKCVKEKDGCGDPVYSFASGKGKVIHLTFHLSQNADRLGDKFLNALFSPKGEYASGPLIYLNNAQLPSFQYQGTMKDSQDIVITSQLIDFASSCKTYPCTFPLTVKAAQG